MESFNTVTNYNTRYPRHPRFCPHIKPTHFNCHAILIRKYSMNKALPLRTVLHSPLSACRLQVYVELFRVGAAYVMENAIRASGAVSAYSPDGARMVWVTWLQTGLENKWLACYRRSSQTTRMCRGQLTVEENKRR